MKKILIIFSLILLSNIAEGNTEIDANLPGIEISRHNGIIASEVYLNPIIGMDNAILTNNIDANNVLIKANPCPDNWIYTCVNDICNCLP
jgi:hypothetical protein